MVKDTVPLGEWFRSGLGDRFREVVLAPDARLRDHLDQSVAGQLLDDHEHGRADNAHRLWALLVFELWARRWLTDLPTGITPRARSIEAIVPAAEVR